MSIPVAAVGLTDAAAVVGLQYCRRRLQEIWTTLMQDNLWKKMFKNVLATTMTVGFCLIHEPNSPFGKAAYLAAMMTVFAHPGRRVGQLIETLSLALAGAIVGVAWSALGIYLSSLVISKYSSAAYAIRGIFLAIAVLSHGYLRSQTPRLFTFVLLLIVVCITGFTTTLIQVTTTFVTQLVYPILFAAGIIILVNICVLPEFSSGYLGSTTIDILSDTAKALTDAGQYFVRADTATGAGPGSKLTVTNKVNRIRKTDKKLNPISDPKNRLPPDREYATVSLSDITNVKSRLRLELSNCQTAQNESQFELAFSVIPPRDMGMISKKLMKTLVASTIAVIGTCESRFALLGDAGATMTCEKDTIGARTQAPTSLLGSINASKQPDLELLKPKREIEYADEHFLRQLLDRIREPYLELHNVLTRTVEVVCATIAFAYDVPKLPSGARVPKGIILEELDQHLEALQKAIQEFDTDTNSAMDSVVEVQGSERRTAEVLPREEIFLISSFLLNLRQAATQITDMLKHSRYLVERRHYFNGRRHWIAPQIHWARWLSGGEESEALPASGRKAARQGESSDIKNADDDIQDNGKTDPLTNKGSHDLEAAVMLVGIRRTTVVASSSGKEERETNKERGRQLPISLRIRGHIANVLEWVLQSEDLLYATKLSIALFIVIWPALVPSLNSWYSLNRGTWAALQLVFVFEVAIGTSINSFIIRAIGTTLGSMWGWVAYEAREGDPVVCTAIIFVGLIPAVYVQLGSKYPKAGMVAIVSMCVVALSTELQTVPGSGTQNFLKRWIAFLIGGTVALVVEMTLVPVKARTRMIESLTTAIKEIGEMEACVAYGIEAGIDIKGFPAGVLRRFEGASKKTQTALAAASTFLPFCSTEPRLKGSFSGLEKIYTEMLFVLHQIVDRMDNMLLLRTVYGSGPLEEFNAQIYPYRRNLAGAITLILYAIREALTTKLPLPQFLPSARLAHLRLINKIRDIVQNSVKATTNHEGLDVLTRKVAMRRKYISWNASAAAQGEVIEYLEELTDLSKLVVGANEFRSGLLRRPTYGEYTAKIINYDGIEDRAGPPRQVENTIEEARLRKIMSESSRKSDDGELVHASLRRIQTRRLDAEIRRRNTSESHQSF